MPTDDHSLVQRARSGDERAFRTLVERYQKKVYAVALGMVKDREEAMDVVQEAFVKVHRYAGQLQGRRDVLHLALPHHRQRLHRRHPSAGRDAGETGGVRRASRPRPRRGQPRGGRPPSSAATPRRRSSSASWGRRFEEALEQIPEKHRAILLLRELDGLSYEELAQALEIPKGTVMSRLFHARAKVQKLLSESLGIPLPAEGEDD